MQAGKPFRPLWSLYTATPALPATMESLVTDVRCTVLKRFPIIAQRSKGTHYFHRVVGLVVLSMSLGTASATWIHRACLVIKAEKMVGWCQVAIQH